MSGADMAPNHLRARSARSAIRFCGPIRSTARSQVEPVTGSRPCPEKAFSQDTTNKGSSLRSTGERSPLERLLVIAVPGQKEHFALGPALGFQPAQPRFKAPDRQHGQPSVRGAERCFPFLVRVGGKSLPVPFPLLFLVPPCPNALGSKFGCRRGSNKSPARRAPSGAGREESGRTPSSQPPGCSGPVNGR